MVKMPAMKRTPALVAVGMALAFAAQAQETVSPTAPAPTADVAALVARVAELEAQLDSCRVQAEAENLPATNMPQPAPAYVPAARYGGGFRMAPEPRLTCDDYSKTYFERHPTMARVCGRGAASPVVPVAEEPALPQPEEVSATAAPAAVSATVSP